MAPGAGMTSPPKIPSLFEQLMAASTQSEKPRSLPTNPFPSGVRVGSITDKVLAALRAEPSKWFEHSDLMRMTGGSRGAVAWAVRYLGAHGQLRAIPSAGRRPQGGGGPLMRYRYQPRSGDE
jgi:hypothetical protein